MKYTCIGGLAGIALSLFEGYVLHVPDGVIGVSAGLLTGAGCVLAGVYLDSR